MHQFKFFSENSKKIEPIVGWRYILDTDEYSEMVTSTHIGITSFLDNFPNRHVVIVSITGPNGRSHTRSSHYDDGWGFNIIEDLITITYVR